MLKAFIAAMPIILPWLLFAITLATFTFKAGHWKGSTPTTAAVKKEVAALYVHCRDERGKLKVEFRQTRQECQKQYGRKLDALGEKVDKLNDTTARLDERLGAVGGIIDTFNKQIEKVEGIMIEQVKRQAGG